MKFHAAQVREMNDVTAVGEVGLFADEVAQRLCSVFGEAAHGCLDTLKKLSSGRGGPEKFLGLYQAGLATVPQWTVDIIQDEVARMEAKYSESQLLLHYVYVLLINLVDPTNVAAPSYIPSLVEVYHLFLKKVCANPDVQLGSRFLDQSFACKRAIFLECLRMALHDLVRQHYRFSPAPARRPILEAADDATTAPPAAALAESPSVFKKAVEASADEKEIEMSPAFFFKAEGGESTTGGAVNAAPDSASANKS